MGTPMEIGFFFWLYTPALIRRMAAAAQRYRYDVVGVADTPGIAMDPWVAATLLAEAITDIPVAICVSNLVSRHPAASAAAIACCANDQRRTGRLLTSQGRSDTAPGRCTLSF